MLYFFFFKKKEKNTWKYHYFIPVYQKSWYDLQFLKYRVWWAEIGNFGSFFALKPWNIKILKKWKHLLEVSFYACVPTTIWCTTPEIQSETDRTFGHFRPFFALLTSSNNPDNWNFKKFKKCLEILSFYTCLR